MRLTYRQLADQQRTAWTAALIQQIQSRSTLERFFPTPEYLPLPWYGRVRQWLARGPWLLSALLQDWSASMDRLGEDVNYRQRTKQPERHLGQTVTWRRYKPISTSATTGLVEPDDDEPLADLR